MPQFDLNQFSAQIFWLLICFIILYLFTFFYVLPRLKKIYQIRYQAIEGKIATAKDYQNQAEEILKQYENDLHTEQSRAHTRIIEKTHIFNDVYHQQKALNDQKFKIQYKGETNSIVARLKQRDALDQRQSDKLAKEMTDTLLKTYAFEESLQYEGPKV